MGEKSKATQVLVVEDDPNEVELLTLAFGSSGYTIDVQIARDGVEALDLLLPAQGRPPPLDLVVMDLHLPRLDGLQLLSHLQGQPEAALPPKVVLTSSEDSNLIRSCYRSGACSVLRKPVDYDGFVCMVRTLANYWFSHNLAPA